MEDLWFAGVDGCPGGWVAVFVRADRSGAHVRVIPRFADIFAEAPAVVAVDMPIGLPERAGPGGRAAENAVRPLLGRRRSSVFSIPSRKAVDSEAGPFVSQAESYAAHKRACAIAKRTSDPPRGVTIQSFMIFPKIREVDAVLQNNQSIARRVYETHPEVAFMRLNKEQPLSEPKKKRGRIHEPGMSQRRELLIAAEWSKDFVNQSPPKGAKADDFLDAIVCTEIARRIHSGHAKPFPNPPGLDAFGLPMAIWA